MNSDKPDTGGDIPDQREPADNPDPGDQPGDEDLKRDPEDWSSRQDRGDLGGQEVLAGGGGGGGGGNFEQKEIHFPGEKKKVGTEDTIEEWERKLKTRTD